MKLSIIVPVYLTAVTLDRCIRSIIGQTFTDFEVILVDDGSTDRSPEICDEWAKRDNRITVIHQANAGLCEARNAGIDRAQGELITFVDSDDFLERDTYQLVVPLTDDCDIVEYQAYCHFGSRRESKLPLSDQLFTDMKEYWLTAHAYEHTYVWNKIFHRELFDDIRFPKGIVFEDVAIIPRLLTKVKRLRTTPNGLYYYCLNEEGITETAGGRELEMLLMNHLPVINKWCDAFYYMHLLNIQMDIYELTGKTPMLPLRRVNPFAHGLSFSLRLKALLLNILGIKGICKLNRLIHKAGISRS